MSVTKVRQAETAWGLQARHLTLASSVGKIAILSTESAAPRDSLSTLPSKLPRIDLQAKRANDTAWIDRPRQVRQNCCALGDLVDPTAAGEFYVLLLRNGNVSVTMAEQHIEPRTGRTSQ